MVLTLIKIFPAAGQRKHIIDVFSSLKGPVEATSGCIGCSITVEVHDDCAVCYLEKWVERSAFDRHLRSEFFNRILEIMEHSSMPPHMEFYEMNKIGGLEIIEEVRQASTAQH